MSANGAGISYFHLYMQTIGILLPRSTYYETIGLDIFQGLKAGIEETGCQVRIVTENIGFGADKQQCYRSAEKLLLEENASIVIAYIGQRGAQLLRPLFLAMNRLLIVLDAGANLPHEADYCPNIIYHSFQNSIGAWLTSKMAINDGIKTGGMVTGYYDGGYLHTVAITEGFVRNGGEIRFNVATGFKPETFTLDELNTHLQNSPGSALLTLFSGDFVQWFFRDLVKHFGVNDIPVYLSPFGLEESMLKEACFPGNHKKGVVTWASNIESDHNKRFVEVMTDRLHKVPTLFALMGWEAALLIDTLLQIQSEQNARYIDPAMLEGMSFEGPRGTVNFYKGLNTTYAPMYAVTLVPTENNTCALQIDEQISDVTPALDQICGIQLNNVETAWYNSYVCI